MRTIVKGFLGAAMVIAIVASLGGYGYAQVVPLIAQVPNTNDYALMELKINAQCTEQVTRVIAPPTVTGSTKKYTNTEKDIIELLSWHTDVCVAGGAFPADIGKAKLYYQYSDGSGFVVKVSDGASTADITQTCMSISQASPPVFSGSEDVSPTINSVKFSMLFDMTISIGIPGTIGADGWAILLLGAGKENLNLPKLNSKGKQTLTDSWSFSGQGFGAAYVYTMDVPVYCTATAQGHGTFKR